MNSTLLEVGQEVDGEGRKDYRSLLCVEAGVVGHGPGRAGEDAEGDALRSGGEDRCWAPQEGSGSHGSICFQDNCYHERKGKWLEQRILPAFSQQHDYPEMN